MNTKPTSTEGESPARRLEILYVASLTAIGLLLTISQSFILWELSWEKGTLRAVCPVVRQRSLDRMLVLSALAVSADEDRPPRREDVEALRSAVSQCSSDSLQSSPAKRVPGASRVDGLLAEADPHRRAAIKAAQDLVAAIDRAGAGTPRVSEIGPLVRAVIVEQESFIGKIGDAVRQVEHEAGAHITRLESLQLRLFIFMMGVLLLEALFVIRPVIRKIRIFMDEQTRAHDELKSYAERLERSNKELQDFASVASHDLQEPLRKVQAFSDRLKSKYGATIDDQGRDYLDRVQNAARRMQTLINDLLTYARVTTKAQPFVPIDLGTATREVVADLEARIEQVGGQVQVGDLPTLDADPLQVRQLMQNLIGNALKYHRPEEPPVVKVYGQRVVFHGEGASADEHYQILVEDNGIGFDEIYTDRIFTIFQRLHGRTEYEGTGVGLAVCRKITERHGGAITARSTPGKGSTFMVTLPVRQPKEGITNGCTG